MVFGITWASNIEESHHLPEPITIDAPSHTLSHPFMAASYHPKQPPLFYLAIVARPMLKLRHSHRSLHSLGSFRMQRFHLYFITKTFFITMIGLFVVQSHVDAQRTAILPLTHRRGVAVPRIWPQVMSEFRAELAQIQTLTIREEDSDTRVEAVEA